MIELKPGEDPTNFNAGEEPMTKAEAVAAPQKPGKRRQAEPVVMTAEVIQETIEKADEKTVEIKHTLEKQEVEQLKNVPAPAPKPQIQMDDRGRANAMNLDEMFRLANALFKGKAFPNWVRSPEQALAICIFLKNLGLEVMTGIQHVCEVNGRLSLWGEGPLAAVRASGKMKSIKEGFYTKDYEEICFKNKNLDAELHFALCTTVRADNGERKETWFTVADEKTANKGLKEVWSGYRRTMFKRKARAENLKDNFGDVLEGAGISEYDNESAPDMQVDGVTNRVPLAERLNQRALEGSKDGEAVQN